jgi:hypothetical protein
MPIVSGGSGGGAGALTQIGFFTLGADGTFDVQNIVNTYNDLLLVIVARATRAAAATDGLVLRLNNDTGANYYGQNAVFANTTSSIAADPGDTGAIVQNRLPAATATAGHFGYVEILIPGYSSTGWQKGILSTAHSTTSLLAAGANQETNGYTWANTAAVARVTLFGQTAANLLAGSSLRIYGVT